MLEATPPCPELTVPLSPRWSVTRSSATGSLRPVAAPRCRARCGGSCRQRCRSARPPAPRARPACSGGCEACSRPRCGSCRAARSRTPGRGAVRAGTLTVGPRARPGRPQPASAITPLSDVRDGSGARVCPVREQECPWGPADSQCHSMHRSVCTHVPRCARAHGRESCAGVWTCVSS